MKILSDCPAILGDWNLGNREALCLENPEPWMASIWRALGGESSPWELMAVGDDLPDTLMIVIERASSSQFDQLVELARGAQELPETLICVALEGENFHGQSKRPWSAMRGNLHLSFFSKLDIPAADLQEEISILPTLALLDAFSIDPNPDEHTGIRWVNDLFIKGRKVAGTITASQLIGERIESVVYGIGVNVEVVPVVEPSPCVPAATSLCSALPEANWTVAKATMELARTLRHRVEELRGGIGEQLTDVYALRSACIGQQVRVWPRNVKDFAGTAPIAKGRLLHIANDLSLRIEGCTEPIREGRLAFEEDCREIGL